MKNPMETQKETTEEKCFMRKLVDKTLNKALKIAHKIPYGEVLIFGSGIILSSILTERKAIGDTLKVGIIGNDGKTTKSETVFNNVGDCKLQDNQVTCKETLTYQTDAQTTAKEFSENITITEYVNKLVEENYKNAIRIIPEMVKNAPSKEKVKESLAKQITKEQFEVIKNMEKPVLQIISLKTSGEAYVKIMNEHKTLRDQKDAYMSDWLKDALKRADERDKKNKKGFEIAITEGVKEWKALPKDDYEKTLKERNEWFKKEYGEKGVSSITLKQYIDLFTQSLKKGEIIDDYLLKIGTSSTFINGELEYDGKVAIGYWWNGNRISYCADCYIRIASVDYTKDWVNARFRPSVVVDVLN